MPQSSLTPAHLFALSQGDRVEGDLRCHWCTAPCSRKWFHDDAPPNPIGIKNTWIAKLPQSPYICRGCWLWRRPRVTITFLTPPPIPDKKSPTIRFLDKQCQMNHSCLVTKTQAYGLEFPQDKVALYNFLLHPPTTFMLSLINKGEKNHLQFCLLNDAEEIKGDTKLHYTIDNKPFHYTVYELEEALRSEPEGKEPGVQTLIRFIGAHKLPTKEQPQAPTPQGGRPTAMPSAHHTIGKTINKKR